MSDPKTVIEEIRAEALGPGSDFWRRQMEQSAPHLSEDQYDGPMQFVRELIQNADDSTYPDGVVPKVTIRRSEREFVFESNERGFLERDVRALCGFGGSEKNKDKSRFIGEKGLGFKSVFQVTDRPEVHSNGFHFRFDRNSHNGLGRAIPEWIDGCKMMPGTRIVLPLRPRAAIPARDPDDLRAEQWILLFLRKISTLSYIDQVQGRVLELGRVVTGQIATLSHRVVVNGMVKQSADRVFRITRRKVDVSGVGEPKRADFQDSGVDIAIPIGDDQGVRLEDAGVAYAFLPVEKTRLRFSLNADLLLVTDRSAPLENQWNTTLCGGLGSALADGIESFCGQEPGGVIALGLLKRSDPAIKPLFERVMNDAMAALRERACVPTIAGKWVLPSRAVLPDAQGLHELLDAGRFAKATGLELADPAIRQVRAEAALLGAKELSLVQFLHSLDDHNWLKARPTEWFGRLYRALSLLKLSPEHQEVLRRMPILRMIDGSTRSAHGSTVFFGVDGSSSYGFEQSMPLIAPEASRSASEPFLDALGVRKLTPKHVIDDFILPRHRSSVDPPLDDEALLQHTCYIIDHRGEYERDSGARPPLKPIWQNLRILTRAEAGPERISPKASRLYLGSTYGDPHGLEAIWGARMPARFISPRYAAEPNPRKKSRDWGKFFEDLRASTRPGMNPSGKDEAPGVAWRRESRELFTTEDDSQILRFLSIVSGEWAYYADAIQSRGLEPEETELVRDLRAIRLSSSMGRSRLDGCVLDTVENRAVFGEDQPYLRGDDVLEIFEKDEFADACGVVVRPSVDRALHRLRALARSGAADASTVRQVTQIYKYLAERIDRDVAKAFETERIVLAGQDSDGWITAKQACWSTGENLGGHCPLRALAPMWPSLREFFVDRVRVPATPTPDAWVRVLRSLSQAAEPRDRTERIARCSYLALSMALEQPSTADAAGRAAESLRGASLILCKDGNWRSPLQPGAIIVFADDARLEEAFGSRTDVAFIALAEADRRESQRLLDALGIRLLRSEARIEVPAGPAVKAPPELAARLRERVEALARVLFHEHREAFERAADRGLFTFLQTADVHFTPSFRVALRSCTVDCQFDAKLLGTGRSQRLFLGRRELDSRSWDTIGVAIADELALPPSLGVCFGRILAEENPVEVERILKRQRAAALTPEARGRLPVALVPIDSSSVVAEAAAKLPETGALDGPSSRASEPTPPIPRAVHQRDPSARDATDEIDESGKSGPRWEGGGSLQASWTDQAGDDADGVDGEVAARLAGESPDGGGIGAEPGRRGYRHPSTPPTPDDEGLRLRGSRKGRRIVPRSRQSWEGLSGSAAMPSDEEFNADVEAAAVAFVLSAERNDGRVPVDMNTAQNPDNPGYDVESTDPETGAVRYIEVKGTSHEWGDPGVFVTSTQLRFAFANGERAWLYVVECALDEARRKCYRIQDFASSLGKVAVSGRLRERAREQ